MIENYSEEWVSKYNKEAELIKKTLGSLILDIQHIGSTSVPGLLSKPIIDIAVLVDSIEDISEFTELLEKIDYSYKQVMASVERIFLRKGDPVEYHLSIACDRHTFWTRQILFRDYLRTHPESIKEYGEIKKEALKDIPENEMIDLSRSSHYSSKKGPFILKILQLAQNNN